MRGQSTLRLVFLLALAFFTAFAQDDESAQSAPRLHISILGGYAYQPLDNFNRYVDFTLNRVNYDPYFGSPTGSAEKIKGNATIEGVLSYRLIGGLEVHGVVSQTMTSGNTSMSYYRYGTIPQDVTRNADFRVLQYGLGGGYRFLIGDDAQLRLSGSYLRARGTWGFEYRRSTSSELESMTGDLKQTVNSWRVGVGFSVCVVGPMFFTLETEYRNLKFTNLEGMATSNYVAPASSYAHPPQDVHVHLAEADTYFGVRSDELATTIPFDPPYIWTSSWPTDFRRATVDLSGFTLKGGLTLEF